MICIFSRANLYSKSEETNDRTENKAENKVVLYIAAAKKSIISIRICTAFYLIFIAYLYSHNVAIIQAMIISCNMQEAVVSLWDWDPNIPGVQYDDSLGR